MLILISICTSFTEVLSVTVPGGCHSQDGHDYLLGSLAAPFCFIRHLPHTHLLLMTACMGTSTVIHLVVFFFHFPFQLKQSGLHKIMNDVHVVISRKKRKWKCSGSCSSKAVIAWLWRAHNTDFFFAQEHWADDCDNDLHPDSITIEMSIFRVKPVSYIVYSCCFIITSF